MDKIIQNLEKLQSQIEESKMKKAQLEGRKEEQVKRLEELGIKDIKEAKNKLNEIQKELDGLDKSIKEKYHKLEEEYEWI